MKKKLLSMLLTAALCVSMSACGGKTAEPIDHQPQDSSGEEQDTKTEIETGTEPQTETDKEQEEPYQAQLPSGEEDADIFVERVKDLPDDFIKGMDVSSVIAEEESGVVYYNEQGEEEDLFRILADAGINYIRVRVWNHPYDKDGNGYGGGNSDVEKAAKIGARAAKYGLKLLVNFHYSDLWADPAKQYAPKEWAHLTLEDKEKALYDFTKESLQTILDAGADVGMVQIGNETNNGMAGEKEWERITPLMAQGSKAVREIAKERGKEIRIAVHFTNIEDHDQTVFYAQTLEDAGLDYDIFGVSYYPYWHGTMENMTTVLKDIKNSFQKETIVLETSYCYTTEDGDGFGNSVGEDDLVSGYAASVQSQACCVRDVIAAANEASALGVMYWEGAWIPVGEPAQASENEKLWEQYGSGWASSYAVSYDKEDAGKYYGGCAWDNQAMFDAAGHPLASLDVFKYVNYGADCEQAVDYVEEIKTEVNLGGELKMPESVDVVYNNRSLNGPAAVVWDEEQVNSIDTSKAGDYTVTGVLEDGTAVTCQVVAARKNWLLNPSFEKNDISMWKVSYKGDSNPTDIQEKESDAMSGANSFHFWSESEQDFKIQQTLSGLEAGSYTVSANIQGGDVGSDAEIYLYVMMDGKVIKSDPVTLNGWCEWQTPKLKGIKVDGKTKITVGMKVKCSAGGWGTMDDFACVQE